jgi:cobalt-zinc-cadmium efflux system membrane fusion protein
MKPEQNSPRPTGRKQWIAVALIVIAGIVAGAMMLRAQPGGTPDGEHAHEHGHGEAEGHEEAEGDHKEEGAGKGEAEHAKEPGKVAMSEAQAKAAGIALETATEANLRQVLQFPGEIRFNEDRTAHVVPRVAGVVERVSADLGQQVKKGQVLAVISSAAVSEQRSELGTAQKRLELARTTYAREKKLWEEKISPEQDVLQARQALREAEIAAANAGQKLQALGAPATAASLGRYELRAPFDGMVVEKHIALGEAVKEDANVFTVSDLSTVWAEMNVGAGDLPRVRVGEQVMVRASAFDAAAEGKVAYVGSLIGEQTRTARARVVLPNPELAWRPGLFVNVEVVAEETRAPVTVATEALQTIDGTPTVFVKVDGGFAAHPVQTGRTDGKRVEIVRGLEAGAAHAAAGSFIVKAEQGKGSASHTH